MRAAYAALILGVVGGFILATGVLSGRVGSRPATVASALAIDVPGVDLDRRRAEAVAVLVARCMTRQGFSWVPWVEPPPPLPDPDLPPVVWAERWGFGIATTAGRPLPVSAADPNLARLSRIGPDERDAMSRALYGSGGGAIGCQAGATDEVYGLRRRLMAPLAPALTALEARIATDAAADGVLAAWRACVEPVAGDVEVDRAHLAGVLMARVSERMDALGSTPRAVVNLAGIQAEERHAATLLARCDAEFSADRAEVAAPHEAAFVDQHRGVLDRIGATIRDAEAALPTLPP